MQEILINPSPRATARRSSHWAIGRFLPLVLAGLISIAVLPVMLVGFLGTQDVSRRLLRDRGDLLIDAVVTPIEQLLTPVSEQMNRASVAIERGFVDADDAEQFEAFVRGLMAATPQVTGISLVLPDGTRRRWPNESQSVWTDGPGLAFRQRLVELAGEGGRWSAPFVSNVDGKVVISYRVPIRKSGRVVGLLTAAVSTKEISSSLGAVATEYNVIPFVLADRLGIVAHPSLSSRGLHHGVANTERLPTIATIDDPVMAAIWDDPHELTASDPSRNATGHWSSVNEEYYTYMYQALPLRGDSSLTAGFYFASSTTQRDRWMSHIVAGIGALLLFISMFGAARVARGLALPITEFGAASAAIGQFDFRERDLARWEHSRIGELADTAAAIRRMAQALQLFERYVPKVLVRHLLSVGNDSSLPHKREMTILFLDLEGYSRFAEGRSAADVASYLNEIFARIGPIIEESGGTIDKYTGDGLMAFWGAPLRDPDHAEHALASALRIADELGSFIARERALDGSSCRIRIGIHSGEVVVGDLGYEGRTNYTVVGNTVNVAKRTEASARGLAPDVPVIIAVTKRVLERVQISDTRQITAGTTDGSVWLIGKAAISARDHRPQPTEKQM
ncbi:hypothetical protein OIU34_15460 [Pararhizobium sp. BT-229]|uniref:adenylate/guanylate cyclase domain-containing protein n=1 Tax=Pararhizobium sp. BT-229 TaxID=2986923 RepID=UPI0021F7E0B5|nr:adenylate/guanylate cyclase domain-containing protein [Pararhizobium sp. BT-229]MCV9963306.1 hypothetical protein [Pararhizobium sp. BT-229]